MELLINNPFRVLGLPATATSRDIAKRVSDLETFAELGKQKRYETDMSAVGDLVRTADAVKTAAQKIEQAESKLFHSFFWFRAGHDVDERALAALASGDYEGALAAWNAELSKNGLRRYSSRLNRAVLRLWIATKDGFDAEVFSDALEDIGFVIDDHLDDSIDEVLGAAAAGLNPESLWKRVIDSLVKVAQEAPGNPFGTNAVGVISHCWSFPPDSLAYITSKVTNPLIERIEALVDASKRLRLDLTDVAALRERNGLDSVEGLVFELQEVFGDDNARFQAVANKFADELSDCAVAAQNTHKDVPLSSMYIDWASRVPSFGQVRSQIAENKETIDRNVDHQKNEELYGPLLKKLKVDLFTLEQAENQFEAMKGVLVRIRAKVGRADEDYMAASSACVGHILGFLIKTVNDAQESNSTAQGLVSLRSTIDRATELTRKLLGLDMDGDTRARVQTNLDTIEGIQRALSAAHAAVMARENRSLFEQIPGWLWVVGVIVLLAMCSSK